MVGYIPMREIVNITEDANQRHLISLEDGEIILELRFYPTIQQWSFDIDFQDKIIKGVKVSLGVLHILNENYPFDFICLDLSGQGVDPFRVDDFSEGRCKLYILDPEDMEDVRGVPVEI